jgi:4-amino-4-deoxy-L-arabinose transferase-like glycosyltransferase
MERHFALLVFLASFLYLYLFRDYTAIDPDEGIILQGAERILRGQVLYRDFFSFFTPGSYYLLALLFKIFGSSILVARNALVCLGSILSVITYLLARRVSSRWVALVTAALTTLTCLPLRFLVLHNWDSTLWACLALYSAVRLVEASAAGGPTFMPRHRGSPKRWAWALGSLIAITILFDQSKGAGLALGLAAGFALLARDGRRRSLLGRRNWLALGAGIAWPFLVTFVWFGAQHGLTLMLADWIWPLHHYSRANHVPYGYQNWSDTTRTILLGSHSWRQNLITMLAAAPCFMVPVLPLVAAGILAYFAVFDKTGRNAVKGRESKVESKNSVGLPPSTFGQDVTRSEESTMQCDRHAYHILVSATLSGLLLSVVAGRADILHGALVLSCPGMDPRWRRRSLHLLSRYSACAESAGSHMFWLLCARDAAEKPGC